MTETKSVKTLKKQLGAAITMVCVAAVALGSSTYAWFTSNNSAKAEKMNVTATADVKFLEIQNAKGTIKKPLFLSPWFTLDLFM